MITAVVLTKNETANIKKCLSTLKWCDEVIVVDDNSSDTTTKIAKLFKARVVTRSLNNNFAVQRNFALNLARSEWILYVDADERVSEELKKEIQEKINSPKPEYDGFLLRRNDFLFGRWLKHGETGSVKLLRLAKRGKGKWERSVHEIWKITGKIKELKNPLLHYPHANLTEFLQEINIYSSLNAQVFLHEGQMATLRQIISYPLAKFVVNYFLKLGFLDGTVGLLHAIMMSFHSFLTRAKLRHLQENAK